jgi:hypothetical protein
MKIPSSYLRETLGSLLDGLTYDDGRGFNDVVPVVASEGIESKYQIFIGSYSDSDRSNKQNFGSNSTQIIEVIGIDGDWRKKEVDEIGELAANIIHPSQGSNILGNDDFSIMVVGKPSINHLTEDSGSGKKITRLILRYFLLIQEN